MGSIYSLDDFIDMVLRHKRTIFLICLLGCIVSLLWAQSQPHLYRSSEVIQIEQPKIAGELAPTTVEGSAARRLQLIEQQVMARTGVAAVREGFADDGAISVLTFTATMETAEQAQAVAREIADRTRALTAAQRQSQTSETLEFFTNKEAELIAQIAALDEEIKQFRTENNLSIEGSSDLRQTELLSLNDSILDIDREIVAAELARDRIDRNARASTIRRLERELADEIDTLNRQRALLVERLDRLKASLETSPEIDAELARFERRMVQLQGNLDVASTRRSEAEVGFSLEQAARGERLTTIEAAPLPDYPITTSRKKRAAMGGIASGILALIVAFLLDFFKPVMRTAKQMERETGLTPVVSIAEIKLPKEPRGLRKLFAKNSTRGVAARRARRNSAS